MAHFYGFVQGPRGEASRIGTKSSGLYTTVASYRGCLNIQLWHDKETGKDMFRVWEDTWQGAGVKREIARGVIGDPDAQE